MHLGDLHFGKLVNGFSMIEDQAFILEQVKSYIQVHKPDALLLAGDIYDRSVPPAKAVSLYGQFLKDVLMDLKTPVLAVAGNHDGAEMLSFGHELFELAHYYVAGKYERSIKKVTLYDEMGPVHFYLLPFADYAIVREVLKDKEIKSLEEAAKATLNLNQLDLEARNVLITHGFVSGKELPLESDSEKKLVIGGKENVSAALFDQFDYVALGHLHRSQRVSHDKIRYSGSLMKYSFSEEFDTKSMTMIEMDSIGAIRTRLLPLKPRRDLRTLKGGLDELLDKPIQEGQEDYLRVILTDKGELLEPMAKLRQVYPNIMTLELERNQHKFFKQSPLAQEEIIKKTPQQLFSDFYEHHCCEPLNTKGEQVIEAVLTQLNLGGDE